ncbi:MAG: carbohydrate-binding family 9-like protein [bacterium]
MKVAKFLVLILLPILLFSDERREYPCYLMSEAPILDGKGEEKAWENLPEATGFYILGGERYAMEKQTYFKAGWTKEGIYIFVRCEEPAMDRITARLKDGELLYQEDSVELFLFPKDAPNYLHLAVNSLGSRWNEIDSTGQPSSPWNWKARAFRGKNFWSVEVMIPFAVLGRIPEDEEKWLINIARNIYTGPMVEHFTCWPPLRGGFHEVQNFALITFREKKITAEESREIEEKINEPFYSFLKGEVEGLWSELRKNFASFREEISYGLGKEKLKDEAIYLRDAWDELEKLVQKQKPSLLELRAFLIKYPYLPSRFKDFHYKVLLEKLFED